MIARDVKEGMTFSFCGHSHYGTRCVAMSLANFSGGESMYFVTLNATGHMGFPWPQDEVNDYWFERSTLGAGVSHTGQMEPQSFERLKERVIAEVKEWEEKNP